MSLLTPSLMIQVAVSTTMQFSMIFYLRSQKVVGGYRGPFLIRSQISFFMSIALVSSDHCSQFAKPLSFFLFDPLEVLSFLFLSIVFFSLLRMC